MSLKNCTMGLALCLVLSLSHSAEGRAAATLSKVEIQADAVKGGESLILRFDAKVPDMEARVDLSGLKVWLPATRAQAMSSEKVRVTSEDGGTRLSLEGYGVRLDSLQIEGNSVILMLSYPAPGEASNPGYHLGVGDVVHVEVYREEGSSGDFTIVQDGTITVHPAGVVHAIGLSETELAARLREVLSDYLVDPKISVSVKEYGSQFVIVTGEVRSASRIPLEPGMTIKDVLSEATVALKASQEVKLTRSGTSGETVTFDASDLGRADIPLPRKGDVLTVQVPAYIFVRGEVEQPGKFDATPGLTLQQAIALAGGLTDWANRKKIRILRKAGGDTVDEIVNLKRVEDRRVPDPELKPGDQVLIRRKIL